MPATPFDSLIYRDLFLDTEIARLFSDSAEVRAMLLVEGALAEVQGKLGLIPEISAAAIRRASLDVAIDPAALAPGTGQSAVPVPALVAAFRKGMPAPEHAQYIHWGATSQDILDTALSLRLRQVLRLFEDRLRAILRALGRQARTHAALPMAGRTYGQAATPTSFGAVAASWGAPLLRHLDRLAELRPRLLVVSLSGAAGTLSAMDGRGPEVRAALAEALDLGDPGESWHSQRDRTAELGSWLAQLAGSLGKMGEDMILMTQTGIGELALPQSGGSSTMPQKQNPVAPSLLVALARQAAALSGVLQGAAVHRQQRDAASWMTEWMSLPQIVLATAQALATARTLAEDAAPVPDRMAAALDDGLGLAYAEALSFALARQMPRPEAQAKAKSLCQESLATGTPLATLAARAVPDTDLAYLFQPAAQLGTAPDDARAFATRTETL